MVLLEDGLLKEWDFNEVDSDFVHCFAPKPVKFPRKKSLLKFVGSFYELLDEVFG